jgi:uncharacterized paraquat-inducible protein A
MSGWLRILCPNCNQRFEDDMPALSDGAFFICPRCEAEVTVTMTWTVPSGAGPEPPPGAGEAPPQAA